MLPPDSVHVFHTNDPVYSLHFQTPDRLLAGTKTGCLQLWDLVTLRSSYSLKVGTNPLMYIAHTENQLITQERTGIAKIFDLTNSGYQKKFEIDSKYIAFGKAECSVSRNMLFSPQGSVNISVIDLETSEEVHLLKPNEDEKTLNQIATLKLIDLDSETFVLAGYDSGHMLLWDLKTNDILSELKYDFPVIAIDYDPLTNRGIVGGGTSSKICLFSFIRNKLELVKREEDSIELQMKDNHKKDTAGIQCLKIRPDKKLFISGGWDGKVRIFSWKSLRTLATLAEHRGEISDVAYSNGVVSMFNSPVMAVGSMDSTISLWDIYYK